MTSNEQNWWARSFTIALVAAALASCASNDSADQPLAGTAGTVETVDIVFEVDSADEAWKLVAIGDSFIGWTTIAEQYAELLEDDLGVEISVDKIVNSTSNRLEHMRTDVASRELLADAQIVVVEPQPGPPASAAWVPYLAGECGGADDRECFRAAQADFALYVGDLFDELVALAPEDATIVAPIVGTWGVDAYNPDLRDDSPATHRLFVEHMATLQKIAAAAAVGRGIGWVDVSRAFSGPVYERVVDERYFEADRTHLTDEGSRIVAELLHGLSAT